MIQQETIDEQRDIINIQEAIGKRLATQNLWLMLYSVIVTLMFVGTLYFYIKC